MTTTASCPSGHALPPGASFCGECGAAIGSEDKGGVPSGPAADPQAPGEKWPPVQSTPAATPSGPGQPFASAKDGAAATPRRRRTAPALIAVLVAVAVVAAGVVVTPRVLALLRDPEGMWLVSRTSSSGDESLYLAEENDGQFVRGPRLAAGELLWPMNAASGDPLGLPYVEWPDRRVFATQDGDSLDVVAMAGEGTAGQELLSVPTANGGSVFAYPETDALLLVAYFEDHMNCHLVRPGAAPLELDGLRCGHTTNSAVALDPSGPDATQIVRYGLDGAELARTEVGITDAVLTPDMKWAYSTGNGSNPQAGLLVHDMASGRVVHDSEPAGSVTVLSSADTGHSLIYALDTGDEQLRIVHLRPDGTARTLTETQVSSAALSDDGRTAWYVTGSLEDADREVFRVTDDSEPTSVGSGDNLQVSYTGGPHPRLIASGRSGESGADVYVALHDGALTLVGDAPDVRFDAFAINPTSGIMYVTLEDDVDETTAEGESPQYTGMLLQIAADGKTSTTLAEDYDAIDSVVASEKDDTVLLVGSSDGQQELLVSRGGQLREIDSSASIPSVFLDDRGDVYFSTSDGDGQDRFARRIPADGSEPPVTVMEDVRWAAIRDSTAPLEWEYSPFYEAKATIDYGARDCASSGTSVVDVFGSGPIPVAVGVTDVCFKVDSSSQVSLTARPESTSDLMMTLTGYTEGGPYVVGTDDDSGAGYEPLINVALEPGTYRITTTPYGSYSSSAYQISGCRAEAGASDPCATPVQG